MDALLFMIFAAIAVVCGINLVVQTHPISSALSLVGVMGALAALYLLLGGEFIAAAQLVVYAGAIMVLFIFVVMVLNRDEPDRVAWNGVLVKAFIGVPAIVYLVWTLSFYLRQVTPAHPEAPPESFGTVAEVGHLLFTDYLFAFEAVSVLLLIAVVAAVVVARAHKSADAPSERQEHA